MAAAQIPPDAPPLEVVDVEREDGKEPYYGPIVQPQVSRWLSDSLTLSPACYRRQIAPELRVIMVVALSEKAGGTALAKLLIGKALPPAPSRAERWWEEHAPGAGIPPHATVREIAEWLRQEIYAGRCSPMIASELLAHFRAIEMAAQSSTAGSYGRPRAVS